MQVVRHGDVRRAKLYYLRGRTGRAARIKSAAASFKTIHQLSEQDGALSLTVKVP